MTPSGTKGSPGIFATAFANFDNPFEGLGKEIGEVGLKIIGIGGQLGGAAADLGTKVAVNVSHSLGNSLKSLFDQIFAPGKKSGSAGGAGTAGDEENPLDIAGGIRGVFESTAQQFTDIFTNFDGNFKNLFKDFKGFFKGFGNRILGGIGGVFKQAAGGILNNLISTGLGFLGVPVPGFAGGGRVQAGVPALVGERGPELIVPQRTSTVMNAASSRQAMGAKPVMLNQTVNFDLQPAPTISAMIDAKKPEIVRAATMGAIQAIQRGGI